MKAFNSIKWRLQIWQMLLLAGVLVTLLFLHYHLRKKELISNIDRSLQDVLVMALPRIAPPVEGARPPFDGTPPPRRNRAPFNPERQRPVTYEQNDEFIANLSQTSCYIAVWDERGSPKDHYGAVPESLKLQDIDRPERGRIAITTRGNYRELIQNQPGRLLFVIGQPLDKVNLILAQTRIHLLLVGLGIMGIGFAGGLLIISRTIRPIREISRTAECIAAGERSRRIELSDAPEELEGMARTLNGTFDHLDEMIENHKRFSADASHELRTPIAVVIAQTEAALKRDRSADEYKNTLKACLRAGQRMKNMAESLLTLTRIDSGGSAPALIDCDLNHVLSGAVDSASLLSEKHPVDFQGLKSPLIVPVDCDRIHQAVMNLLINAMQHNPDGCPIHVSLHEKNNRVVIKVADEGSGIPEEHLPHIFERFYRVDKSRSRAHGGAGLGLSIVQSLIEAHGGTIDVSSEPGRKTAFIITLPQT